MNGDAAQNGYNVLCGGEVALRYLTCAIDLRTMSWTGLGKGA